VIAGAENLASIFSIFHDGGIASYCLSAGVLVLDVEIMYLAERVNPGSRSFRVSLRNVRDLHFSTWPKGASAQPSVLRAPDQIFHPELEIMSGEADGDRIKVLCNQPSSSCDYCGGELYLAAESATVIDEDGRDYSIDELRQISKAYWDEWASRRGD
jgi:hypothetical protein